MLGIFSCVYLPSVHILFSEMSLYFVQFIIRLFFFVTEFQEFFIYSRYWSFVTNMV